MNAIVCDCCGKTVLLSDSDPYFHTPKGITTLRGDPPEGLVMDLCDKCVGRLVQQVRETKGGDGDG